MPIRGEAEARLTDGRVLALKVNFATLARAAAAEGIPAAELAKAVADPKDPRQMLALLALTLQALRVNHRDIDEDQLGDLMLTNGDAIGGAVMTAFEGAFGGDDEGAEGREQSNPPGTGTRSKARGPKPAKTRASSGNRHRAAM